MNHYYRAIKGRGTQIALWAAETLIGPAESPPERLTDRTRAPVLLDRGLLSLGYTDQAFILRRAGDPRAYADGVELGQTGAGPADDAPYAEGLRAGRVLIAEDDVGEPVGFLYLESLDDHPHIEELAVHPRAQRQGLGAALLRACYALCRDRGAGVLSLSTFSHLPWNAPFYAREGFMVVPEDAWTPGMLALRAHEARLGLRLAERVLMIRSL